MGHSTKPQNVARGKVTRSPHFTAAIFWKKLPWCEKISYCSGKIEAWFTAPEHGSSFAREAISFDYTPMEKHHRGCAQDDSGRWLVWGQPQNTEILRFAAAHMRSHPLSQDDNGWWLNWESAYDKTWLCKVSGYAGSWPQPVPVILNKSNGSLKERSRPNGRRSRRISAFVAHSLNQKGTNEGLKQTNGRSTTRKARFVDWKRRNGGSVFFNGSPQCGEGFSEEVPSARLIFCTRSAPLFTHAVLIFWPRSDTLRLHSSTGQAGWQVRVM